MLRQKMNKSKILRVLRDVVVWDLVLALVFAHLWIEIGKFEYLVGVAVAMILIKLDK